MAAPVALAIVTGTSVRAEIRLITTSTVKRMPPMGVLNVAAIPPAAPAAIRPIRS